MRHLNDLDVEALNLVLAADSELAAVVFARLDAVEKAALPPPPSGPRAVPSPGIATPPPPPPMGLEEQIATWFHQNPGPHALGEVRAALSQPAEGQGAKAFKVALHRAIESGRVASTGKRGLGASYWAALKAA